MSQQALAGNLSLIPRPHSGRKELPKLSSVLHTRAFSKQLRSFFILSTSLLMTGSMLEIGSALNERGLSQLPQCSDCFCYHLMSVLKEDLVLPSGWPPELLAILLPYNLSYRDYKGKPSHLPLHFWYSFLLGHEHKFKCRY